jgi:hypothetical protein
MWPNKINKLVLVVLVFLMPALARAMPCTPAIINQNSLKLINIEIGSGITSSNVSNLLGCTPTTISHSSATWSARDASYIHQIVVEFIGGKAAQAKLQNIPITAGGSDNSNAAAAVAVLGIAALAGGGGSAPSAAISGCTPATVNTAAITQLRPYETLSVVTAQLGCAPSQFMTVPLLPDLARLEQSPAVIGATWRAGSLGQLGEIDAVFDVTKGLISAIYVSPGGIAATYTGGFRQIPPDTVLWQLNSGSVALQ